MRTATIIAAVLLQLWSTTVEAYNYRNFGRRGPGGGVGAPGPFGGVGGAVGAPGPFGGAMGGRPISPGGRVLTPDDDEDGAFGSMRGNSKDEQSPQQVITKFGESGVKDSPQINPGSIKFVSSFESGVRDDPPSPIIGCPGRKTFSAKTSNLQASSGTGGALGMCLDILCAIPCRNGYVMDAATGCRTCQCLQSSDSLLQSCPNTPVEAMWKHSSSNQILVFAGQQLYSMRGGEELEALDRSMEDVLEAGSLCQGLDAAFTASFRFGNGKEKYTVYFSGDKYAVYSKMFGMVTGPHSIHNNWESGRYTPLRLQLPLWAKKIDSAMAIHHKLYLFFKYDNETGYFAVYNLHTHQMDPNYPKRTQVGWQGLPLKGPDAAVFWNRKIYFTVGDMLYVSKGADVFRMKISMSEKNAKDNFLKCPE